MWLQRHNILGKYCNLMLSVWMSFNKHSSCLCTPCKSTRRPVITNRTDGHSCSKDFSFNVDAHGSSCLTFASFWITQCLPDWIKRNNRRQIAVPPWQDNNQPAWPRFKVQYKVRPLKAHCLAWHWFVCAEQQLPLAGCAESEVVWNHERRYCISVISINNLVSFCIPSGFVRCHLATKSRYQVIHEVMCGLIWCSWGLLSLTVGGQWWNQGFKAKNKLNETMYTSLLM